MWSILCEVGRRQTMCKFKKKVKETKFVNFFLRFCDNLKCKFYFEKKTQSKSNYLNLSKTESPYNSTSSHFKT